MLTYEDGETSIRHGILKRLGKEKGVSIVHIEIEDNPKASPPFIRVGMWWMLTDTVQELGLIDGTSVFDLKAEFELRDVHNQIDEIAEQIKEARRNVGQQRLVITANARPERQSILGTGLRGRWRDGVLTTAQTVAEAK